MGLKAKYKIIYMLILIKNAIAIVFLNSGKKLHYSFSISFFPFTNVLSRIKFMKTGLKYQSIIRISTFFLERFKVF